MLTFLMARVREACVALAALVGFIRESGSDSLINYRNNIVQCFPFFCP